MSETYNIYCDESCHLPYDKSPTMVLGCIRIPVNKKVEITERIIDIKAKYDISIHKELKWTKVSPSLCNCYEDIINYFFDDDDLFFRALIVDNKKAINNDKFNQEYDDLYYKLYFNMLKTILSPNVDYNIYLDIKDTRSKNKIKKLRECLRNSHYDFSKSHIKKMQVVRSHEIEIMQIVDLLIGALSYTSRNLSDSQSKLNLINLIKKRSGYDLIKNTPYLESKFNVFHLQLEEQE